MRRFGLLIRCLTAVGVLFAIQVCRAGEPAKKPQTLSPPFTAERFREHAAFLASDELAGRLPGSEGSAKAAEYIIRHLKEFGLTPLSKGESYFQEFRWTTVAARNILAVLPGRGKLASEAVIVSAHYDHIGKAATPAPNSTDTIYNGADDNASGVAALLLVAESLCSNRTSGRVRDKLPASHRTIIFAVFDAEEQGLLGSRYYVEHPLWPLARTAAIINIDAIGRLRGGKFYASEAERNPVLAKSVRDAARDCGLLVETRLGGIGRSDHQPFIERGIPGMHFFTGAHSDYHQVTDEVSKLNLDAAAKIAWVALNVVQTAATYPGPLEFRQLNPFFDASFAISFLAQVGIVPVQNAQEGRYPQIMFVFPGSAAAKVGLKSGDQVAAINGLRFTRVEDGLTIFDQLNFDSGMRVSILRAGKEFDLAIPPSFFDGMRGPKPVRLPNGKNEVVFRYQGAKDEKTVYLAGTFNDWKPTALRMDGPDAKGIFTKRLELPAGTYEYKFVIDGKRWKADPKNLGQVGQTGNSVLSIEDRKQ